MTLHFGLPINIRYGRRVDTLNAYSYRTRSSEQAQLSAVASLADPGDTAGVRPVAVWRTETGSWIVDGVGRAIQARRRGAGAGLLDLYEARNLAEAVEAIGLSSQQAGHDAPEPWAGHVPLTYVDQILRLRFLLRLDAPDAARALSERGAKTWRVRTGAEKPPTRERYTRVESALTGLFGWNRTKIDDALYFAHKIDSSNDGDAGMAWRLIEQISDGTTTPTRAREVLNPRHPRYHARARAGTRQQQADLASRWVTNARALVEAAEMLDGVEWLASDNARDEMLRSITKLHGTIHRLTASLKGTK